MKLPLKLIGCVFVWLRDIVHTHRFTTAATISVLGLTATYTGTSVLITFAEKAVNVLDKFDYNAKDQVINENSELNAKREMRNVYSEPIRSGIESVRTPSDNCSINRRGLLKSRFASNRCLDVRDGRDGTPLKLQQCSNIVSQTFMVVANDNTIRAMGKCVGIKGGSTRSGTAADMFDCHNANTQKWFITSSGEVINMQANKCLHCVTNRDSGEIQIQDCDGSDNQRWILPEP